MTANSQNLSSKVTIFTTDHFDGFYEIDPEDVFEFSEQYMHMGDRNPYAKMIERSNVFLDEGLTPIFMSDESGMILLVSSEEHREKKFH